MEVVHAYKVYRPDADGGIPHVINLLSASKNPQIKNRILVARVRGKGRELTIDGIPVTAVSSLGTAFSMPLAPGYPFALWKAARRADVLVHHSPFPLNDLVALTLRKQTALVIYWHAEIVGRGLLVATVSPFIRAALNRADRIIVSDESILKASKFLQPHLSKCAIVPYGIDVHYWRDLTEEDISRIAVLKQKYPRLLVAVGRLVAYKGFDILLQALRVIDCQLVIIGDGPLEGELKAMANSNKVADRVQFLGRVTSETIKQHLHAARVFVLPSVTSAEAFGLVQVEAMAAGLPVVNTSLSTAVPNVARHAREGLTVQPGDPVALADAANKLLSNNDLADSYGRAGQLRAITEFDQEIYRTKIEHIFAEAVRRRRG